MAFPSTSAASRPAADTGDRPFPTFDRRELRGFERVSVPICDAINTTGWLKDFIQLFVRYVTASWIALVAGPRWKISGLEKVRDLRPPRGVILVSNHRSFFDMYVTCAALYKKAGFLRRLLFPVRSKFFYSHPVGLLVNLAVSGCAMWPAVFRDDRKKKLNPTGMQQVAWALSRPGAILGYHPEGTRGKGPDPYEFLPARPGLGRLLQDCHPETIVLPFFILGMSSNLKREIRYTFWKAPADGSGDIRIRFGTPQSAADFQDQRSDQQVSEDILETIRQLAEEDRLSRTTLPETP